MARLERFFIVGAQRSSTTYLCKILDEHPEVELAKPLRPEPKFFLLDELHARGLDWYEQHFFPARSAGQVLGEKSTSYCESDQVADRIAQAYPGAGIVFLLREPVQRAVSNYWFSHGNGFETLSPAEALTPEAEQRGDFDPARVSSSPFAYLSRGHYVEHLDRYHARFPAEQIRVLLTEDLSRSDATLRSLYAWLGVDADFRPPSRSRVLNASPRGESDLDAAALRALREHFRPWNEQLSARYGLDLSLWAADA